MKINTDEKEDSGSAGTGARGAGGIKSNRREGEGQRVSSGDDEGMRCSRERGKAVRPLQYTVSE